MKENNTKAKNTCFWVKQEYIYMKKNKVFKRLVLFQLLLQNNFLFPVWYLLFVA